MAKGAFTYLYVIVGSLRNMLEVALGFNKVCPPGAQFGIINLVILQLQAKVGVESCQHAIFATILNLLFPKLASPIPTVATPLNVKPPIPLYFYPLYVKSHQDEHRTILPLEKTSVQSHSVSLRDIQPSKSNKCLSRAKGFNDYY